MELPIRGPTSSWNVTPSQRQAVEFQQSQRGEIIGSFSQCEFLISDIAVKSRMLQEYWHLKTNFHKNLRKKIHGAKQLFEVEGPLFKYASRMVPMLDQFEEHNEIRDFMAHASCSVCMKGDDATFEYRMLRRAKDSSYDVEVGRLDLTSAELQELAEELTELAQNFLLLFREIYVQEDLELWQRLES